MRSKIEATDGFRKILVDKAKQEGGDDAAVSAAIDDAESGSGGTLRAQLAANLQGAHQDVASDDGAEAPSQSGPALAGHGDVMARLEELSRLEEEAEVREKESIASSMALQSNGWGKGFLSSGGADGAKNKKKGKGAPAKSKAAATAARSPSATASAAVSAPATAPVPARAPAPAPSSASAPKPKPKAKAKPKAPPTGSGDGAFSGVIREKQAGSVGAPSSITPPTHLPAPRSAREEAGDAAMAFPVFGQHAPPPAPISLDEAQGILPTAHGDDAGAEGVAAPPPAQTSSKPMSRFARERAARAAAAAEGR